MASSKDYNMGILGVKKPLECSCQELLSTIDVKCYGWLRKRALRNKLLALNWPQVYVIVANQCLYYFSNEMSKKASGSLSFYGFNRICRASRAKVKEVVWAFKLEHIQTTIPSLYFSASSEKEMVKWMRVIKNEMLKANGKEKPVDSVDSQYGESIASEDSWGSCEYNLIESSIYEQPDTLRPMSMLMDSAETDDSAFEDSPDATPREKAPSLPRPVDAGYSVEKFISKDPPSQCGNDYWNAVRFTGTKTEASEIISSIGQDGVYLVRKSEDNTDVLVVYVGGVKKYKIWKKDDSKLALNKTEEGFDNLENMLYHYYSNNLPNCKQKLICPFQLHEDFHDYEGLQN